MKKALIILILTVFTQAGRVSAEPTLLEERIAREERWKEAGLFLLPHRPNYVLPVSYNGHPNEGVYPPGSEPLDTIETKFQVSVKVPLFDRLWKYNVGTYLAYTQVSFWQSYNSDRSSSFRESNYEPEFFLQLNDAIHLGPITNRFTRIGFAHQSNGQSDPLSRSWNRMYAEFVLDYKNAMLSIKPWYRLSGDPESDNNPDFWKYFGYGELRGAMMLRKNELSLLFRNNLRSPGNKGAVELGWAFPLIRSMKGFIQYFNGYGDSLLDYNVPVSRLSAGVSFSDWL